jgi:glycosyltransferase involved in cell wall biosynthesis
MPRKLRILYAAGPGNVIGTYQCWRRGEDDSSVPDIAYSRQFFDVCTEIRAAGWVIGAQPTPDLVQDGFFRIEHRPIPFERRGGLAFHVGRLWYSLGLIWSAIRYRADVVVVAHGVHWFMLSLLAWVGVKVVPAVHNTLWLPMALPKRSERLLLRLARPLFARQSFAILSHPGTCARQVVELSKGMSRPIVPFVSLYRKQTFAGLPERGEARPPFRVMFAGRIEANKGVFDLVTTACELSDRGRTDIEFEVCGTGSALENLRHAVSEAQLGPRFRCHGRLEMREFRQMFGRCHVVIVPTRAEYSEGFNAVVVEAILSGRPVIASTLCPAVDLVREAAVEVEPQDLAGYRDAILRFCDDDAFYEKKRIACAALGVQFQDWNRGWGAGLRRILDDVVASQTGTRNSMEPIPVAERVAAGAQATKT